MKIDTEAEVTIHRGVATRRTVRAQPITGKLSTAEPIKRQLMARSGGSGRKQLSTRTDHSCFNDQDKLNAIIKTQINVYEYKK